MQRCCARGEGGDRGWGEFGWPQGTVEESGEGEWRWGLDVDSGESEGGAFEWQAEELCWRRHFCFEEGF